MLGEGEAFGIYPEGTRSRDGRPLPRPDRRGFLTLTAKVPVVPVALTGTQDIQPVDARFPRLAKVSVTFGKPLEFTERYAGCRRVGRAGGSRTRSWTPSPRCPARNEPTATTRSLRTGATART